MYFYFRNLTQEDSQDDLVSTASDDIVSYKK